MPRVVVSLLVVGSILVLASCGLSGDGEPDDGATATIGAYQTQVAELQTETAERQTRVGELETAVSAFQTVMPIFGDRDAELQMAFADAWRIEITGVETYTTYPDFDDNSNRVTVTAKGKIMALRVRITNLTNQPIDNFPTSNVLLKDDRGRAFSHDSDVTSSYVVIQTDIFDNRTDGDLQPGLTYEDGFAFDVPRDATGFTMTSEDGTLNVEVPPVEAFFTPTPEPSATPTSTPTPAPTVPPTITPIPTPTSTPTPLPRVGGSDIFTYQTWTIEVVGVTSEKELSQGLFTYKANGVYQVVALRIRNHGDASTPFPFNDFFIQETYGARYPIDNVIDNGGNFAEGDVLIPTTLYFRRLFVDTPNEAKGLVFRSEDGTIVVDLEI